MNNLELDRDLLSLLPPWYRDILDYQEICKTERAQFDVLAKEITAVADNFFFQTMDDGTVSMWEQIFGIIAAPGDTLSFRRTRVLNRLTTRPPFTMRFLEQRLDELIGPGAWTVTMDYPNYTLYIDSSAEDQEYAVEVSYTVNRIKPAHIVFINRPYTTAAILLNEQIGLAQRVYNYKLGAWGLGLSPFASEKDKGVIKMPAVPSIQEPLLSGVAKFTAGDIEKVRLNGSILVTALNKTAEGGKVTLTYTVTKEQSETVTLIELLNASDTVLSKSTVYVPIVEPAIFTHTINVKEGV